MSSIDKDWEQCTPAGERLFIHPGTGLYVRDRGDVGIIQEQFEWRHVEKFDYHGATILDLGGHIGCAARFLMTACIGAERCVSVEPDPNNIRVFHKNHGDNPSVMLLEGAVVSRANVDEAFHETINLFLGKTYPASNTLFPVRGRQSVVVDVFDFEFLVSLYRPRLIKCDIEGSEYLINWEGLPDCVQEIAMELHFNRPDWENEMFLIRADLAIQGFKAVKEPKYNSFRKVCTAFWSRRI